MKKVKIVPISIYLRVCGGLFSKIKISCHIFVNYDALIPNILELLQDFNL
jgi:hypothetical protein